MLNHGRNVISRRSMPSNWSLFWLLKYFCRTLVCLLHKASFCPAQIKTATWGLVCNSWLRACKCCRKRVEKLKSNFTSTTRQESSEEEGVQSSQNGQALPKQKHLQKRSGLAKWGLQGRVLLQRSWRQIRRDKATNVARVMSNVSSAIIFGSIYWRMGKKQTAVQNRLGLLQVRHCTSVSLLKNTLPCLSDMHNLISCIGTQLFRSCMLYMARNIWHSVPLCASLWQTTPW